MHLKAEKPKENKSRAVANSVVQEKLDNNPHIKDSQQIIKHLQNQNPIQQYPSRKNHIIQKLKETSHVPGVGDLATHGKEDWNRLKQIREGLEDQEYRDIKINDIVVYRGDTRHWSEIFKTGFTQQSLLSILESSGFNALDVIKQVGEHAFGMPKIRVSGEKVLGGISTSTDESTARRKYGVGGYVYAIHIRSGGYDFRGVNDLEEINTVGVPPEDIIGAVGPIREVRTEYFGPPDGYEAEKVVQNPSHTVNPTIANKALLKLMQGVRFTKSQDDSLITDRKTEI
jgi:hypothetical protein